MSKDNYNLFVGMDIAKSSISIAALRKVKEKPRQVDIVQSASGYRRLQKFLRRYETSPEQTLIVMEATSTYWLQVAQFLYRLGYPVSVINPATAYYFARSVLKREKNDPMDAETLAEMGIVMTERLKLWVEPPPIYEELRQRLTQRDELVHLKVQTLNRRHALQARAIHLEAVEQRTQELLVFLNLQIKALEEELEQIYCTDESTWGQSAQYLLSIKGVGTVTAAWIQVATQNMETFDTAKQVASFAGLVPRQRQSGSSLHTRGRIGYAGHARLRHALYIATMTAIQHNSQIKQFYARLLANAKPRKVAIVASARKLLHIAFACVKNETLYNADKQ